MPMPPSRNSQWIKKSIKKCFATEPGPHPHWCKLQTPYSKKVENSPDLLWKLLPCSISSNLPEPKWHSSVQMSIPFFKWILWAWSCFRVAFLWQALQLHWCISWSWFCCYFWCCCKSHISTQKVSILWDRQGEDSTHHCSGASSLPSHANDIWYRYCSFIVLHWWSYLQFPKTKIWVAMFLLSSHHCL